MLDERLTEVKTVYQGTMSECCTPREPLMKDWLEVLPDYAAVVDEKSTILACNSAFERLKANKSLVYVYSSRINFYDKNTRFWFHEFLQGEHADGNAVHQLKTQEQTVVLKLSVLKQKHISATESQPQMCLLLIENFDLNVRVERYKRFFSLTQAEAILAANLSVGKTVNQLADEKLLSKHTLRTQLKSVFLKTETHSQNELVVLLKNVV
jgi:DNA-binding CsgD family transcriptional regulator